MRPRLNAMLPAALLVAFALPGAAQTQGRIAGSVVGKDGKPIVGAKISLKRTDRTWSKDITTDARGSFSQAGLDPVYYAVTITAEGYMPFAEQWKAPIGDSLLKTVVLYKVGEAGAPTGSALPVPDSAAGAKEESEGLELFNMQVIPLVKDGKYLEAMAPSEAAYSKFKEAMDKTVDEKAKSDLVPKLNMAERIYGICLFENGKKAEAKPILEKVFARNEAEAKLDKSKWDQRVLDCLSRIATDQKDAEGEKKYQAIIDSIVGPRPEVAYNDGVTAYNANKIKEAKAHIQKAIQIKPDFPDSYYMLGLIELNENNLKAAKQHFHKYLELAPNGKKAAEVKDMLKAL